MSQALLRGRLLSFVNEPTGASDHNSYTYIEDGGLLLENGKIVAVGDFDQIRKQTDLDEYIDHLPHLILPGFIDPHVHYPQMQVVGSYGAQLIDWLNTYTFVEEQKFADEDHAGEVAEWFCDELIRNGTTTSAVFCTVHKVSAEALFRASAKRNMAVVAGKLMMDCHAPDALTDTPQSGYDDSKALVETWHGQQRAHYAISPRFALTSSAGQLEMAGALAEEFPDCYVQTHLSENAQEIERAAVLFPECPDYTGIYERYGLLGRKTLLGHCIHLDQREMDVVGETGSVAVHCPTSNLFLGSGLIPRKQLKKEGIRYGVATDIGGGTSYSMLQTLDAAYKIQQLLGHSVSALNGFYDITLGNAKALSLEHEIGSLTSGNYADLVVLDVAATPAMQARSTVCRSLEEELFVLQTMGDDRSVAQTYVAGIAHKVPLSHN